MSTSTYVESLFHDEAFDKGQVNQLNKIRFSLSAIWNTLALRSAAHNSAMLFTGCSVGDGSSFVSLHMTLLAVMEFGLETLFVDTDFDKRQPSSLAAADSEGLSNYLQGFQPLEELIQKSKLPGLSVLPSGRNRGESCCNLLTQKRYLDELLAFSRDNYQVVIFDCPPVPVSPWTISLSQMVDHVILVARYATSRRQVCMHTVEKLKENNIVLAGMVLNEREYPIPMNIYNWLK
jgi:Mrp family chromosome partitioning ATPase